MFCKFTETQIHCGDVLFNIEFYLRIHISIWNIDLAPVSQDYMSREIRWYNLFRIWVHLSSVKSNGVESNFVGTRVAGFITPCRQCRIEYSYFKERSRFLGNQISTRPTFIYPTSEEYLIEFYRLFAVAKHETIFAKTLIQNQTLNFSKTKANSPFPKNLRELFKSNEKLCIDEKIFF